MLDRPDSGSFAEAQEWQSNTLGALKSIASAVASAPPSGRRPESRMTVRTGSIGTKNTRLKEVDYRLDSRLAYLPLPPLITCDAARPKIDPASRLRSMNAPTASMHV